MDNKDLFNAIDIAAEEYVADLRKSIEGERPIVLRAEKKPLSLVKRIAVAAAACAAVVAVGVGVTIGVKNYSQYGFIVSGGIGAGNSERNFAPSAEILRIRDVGFYTVGMNDGYRFLLEENYKNPLPKDEKLHVKDSVKLPDVFYFNDMPLDRRMLSHKTDLWLLSYCLMSEEDRAGEIVPGEVKYLTGSGLVRFGDLGYLRDKYTEQELERFQAYCTMPSPYSSWPPVPDVYYYNDIPYHLDQIGDEDAKNWLKWFCWLDEGTQEALSGYVPEAMNGKVTLCNSEKPQEIVTYKGRALDVRSVSYDTERYIKWYNTLSEELKAKVGYQPQELSKFAGEKIIWNDREIIRLGHYGFYTDLYSEEEMARLKAYYAYANPGLFLSLSSVTPPQPDVYFFKDTPYDKNDLSAETINWLEWYYCFSFNFKNPMGYIPSELIAPADPLVRTEIYCFMGVPFKESELSDDTIRWLNWFDTLSEEKKADPYSLTGFYIPSELSKFGQIRNPIPAGADPDAPLPCGLVGPDGVKLTYKEAAYATVYDNNDAPADLDNLEPGMMLVFDFVYLAEPGSSEFKRYKSGDSFYGMTVEHAEATFTIQNGDEAPSYQGDVWFLGSLTVDAYMVYEDTGRADCNTYMGAADGLPHIGFSRDKDSGEVVPFDYTISRWINSNEHYAAAPGNLTTDKGETLPLNTTFKLTLNDPHLMGTDSSQALFFAGRF